MIIDAANSKRCVEQFGEFQPSSLMEWNPKLFFKFQERDILFTGGISSFKEIFSFKWLFETY